MNILSPSATATHSPRCTPLVPVLCKADCNYPVQSLASRLTLRCGFCCADFSPFPDGILSPSSNVISWKKRQRRHDTRLRTTRRESPYEVLGISPSASADQIKRAYRRLALKYHPDVNKEANAQEKFMRVKHAYNTLLNSEARRRYDSSEERYDSSYSTAGRNQTQQEEEEFYGFGDFLKDLQEEFQNWESSAASQGKPKSLWEELAEIGEDFVEFLEKELNISDQEDTSAKTDFSQTQRQPGKGNASNNDDNIEESIDEIEAMLAQLKKELGL